MRQNIISSIMMVLTVALSVVSCSNETEEPSVEARVLELKHKIYAMAEEYGVRNYTINEENLRVHLDMTDAEIDNEFKSMASMAGTYLGKKGADGIYHLKKLQPRLTRYSGVYPEQWSGSVDGEFKDAEWTVSFSLDYYYADDNHCKVSCTGIKCEIVTENGNYGCYKGVASDEECLFVGSIAFEYSARLSVYYEQNGVIRKEWNINCSYDENSDDNDLIVSIS